MIKKTINVDILRILDRNIGFSVWMAKPWLDHDLWRWFPASVEYRQADHFSNLERVLPYRTMLARRYDITSARHTEILEELAHRKTAVSEEKP